MATILYVDHDVYHRDEVAEILGDILGHDVSGAGRISIASYVPAELYIIHHTDEDSLAVAEKLHQEGKLVLLVTDAESAPVETIPKNWSTTELIQKVNDMLSA